MNMHVRPVHVEPKTVLVDARNPEVIQEIKALIQRSTFVGFDLETEDSRRHEGLNRYCKYNDEGFKAKNTRTVFDWRRTVITGCSFYSEAEAGKAYYINTGHSDVENRLPVEVIRELLEALPEGAHFVAHNSAFEQTVVKAVLGFDFKPGSIICTMTQCVSAYGPDTYDQDAWRGAGQGAIAQLVDQLIRYSTTGYDRETGEMSPQLQEIVFKIIGKSSKAAFSWNGFVSAIAYGYGLKQAVKSHFGVTMATFQDTLDGEAHMGMVTGEQVAAYGADDSYWAVRLFRHLLTYMMRNGGKPLVDTFFSQENLMPAIFASIAIGGMRVNAPAIRERILIERKTAAQILREMKAAARELRFPEEPNERLLKYEKWYGPNAKGVMGYPTYRAKIQNWLDQPDEADDYQMMLQVRGPVSNAWAAEHGVNEKKLVGVNMSHYMPVRTILYDLIGCHVVVSQGKVQSDGEARGRVLDRLKDGQHLTREQLVEAFNGLQSELHIRIAAGGEDGQVAQIVFEENDARWARIEAAGKKATREDMEPFAKHHNRTGLKIIDCLNRLSGVEQRMKLFLVPYEMLTDPETNRMYPQVSSLLATRRMGCSSPNAMQLGKRGDSAYVRGFFLGDYDDHLIVSLDWSGVELVEIGEFSGDPEFFKAFGQIPHLDLHAGTATALLTLDCPGMNLELFKSLKGMTSWQDWLKASEGKADRLPRLMTNLKGELLVAEKAYGYWRTVFGKEANFNYFYSGWLATIGERAGWSQQKTADATDAYRSQFPVAEAWRVQQISDANMLGFVTMPDGHRYTRYEATNSWGAEWCDKFMLQTLGAENYNAVIRWIMRKIQKRAGNQTVNAFIQGTCATLAKRSIVRTIMYFKALGWTDREFRFLVPIHDELVWSVHQDRVVEFIKHAHRIMIDHGDIFKNCKLDSSPAIGVTFEPWNAKKAFGGQIELYEPEADVVGKERAGKRLDDQGILDVVEYLKDARVRMKEAA